MTSLSRPISRYLHNDSIDLNSPQSFGSLHHPFLPALLCYNLLLSSSPRHQPGLSAVLCKEIFISNTRPGVKVCPDFLQSPEKGGERFWHIQITP